MTGGCLKSLRVHGHAAAVASSTCANRSGPGVRWGIGLRYTPRPVAPARSVRVGVTVDRPVRATWVCVEPEFFRLSMRTATVVSLVIDRRATDGAKSLPLGGGAVVVCS